MSNHVSLCLMASLPFLLLVFVHAAAAAAAAAAGNDDAAAAAAASGNDDADRCLQVASFAAKLRAEAGLGDADEDGAPGRGGGPREEDNTDMKQRSSSADGAGSCADGGSGDGAGDGAGNSTGLDNSVDNENSFGVDCTGMEVPEEESNDW